MVFGRKIYKVRVCIGVWHRAPLALPPILSAMRMASRPRIVTFKRFNSLTRLRSLITTFAEAGDQNFTSKRPSLLNHRRIDNALTLTLNQEYRYCLFKTIVIFAPRLPVRILALLLPSHPSRTQPFLYSSSIVKHFNRADIIIIGNWCTFSNSFQRCPQFPLQISSSRLHFSHYFVTLDPNPTFIFSAYSTSNFTLP